MHRPFIAALVFAETLVFAGIVHFSVQLGHDLARPHLAARTVQFLSRAVERTRYELALVGTHLHHHEG